jgi:hypothetical protein
VSTVPAFTSVSHALEVACAALGFAAGADLAGLPDAVKAECLHGYERAAAILTAGRAWTLGSYMASQGYGADAEYSAGAWLRHKTRVTKGAARGHVGWARRAAAHPGVLAALAEGTVLTESMARIICGWTGKLPVGCRPPRTRSWSPPPGPGPTSGTWPGWPPRSTPAPCRPMTMARRMGSGTGRSGWRPPSPAPGCWQGT